MSFFLFNWKNRTILTAATQYYALNGYMIELNSFEMNLRETDRFVFLRHLFVNVLEYLIIDLRRMKL